MGLDINDLRFVIKGVLNDNSLECEEKTFKIEKIIDEFDNLVMVGE
jgi:hypothetical protein